MATRGHSQEAILRVLREAESGETAVEVCRKHGISRQTLYLWKKKCSGLGLSELRELRQLREESSKLNPLVSTHACNTYPTGATPQPVYRLQQVLRTMDWAVCEASESSPQRYPVARSGRRKRRFLMWWAFSGIPLTEYSPGAIVTDEALMPFGWSDVGSGIHGRVWRMV